MKLRALKRRHASRPPTEPWAWLRGLKWTRAEQRLLAKRQPVPIQFNEIRGVTIVHSEITAAELIAQPPGEAYTGPLLRGELGVVDCGFRFVEPSSRPR